MGAVAALGGAVAGGVITLFMRARLIARLGGYTGDTMGAVQQVSELSFYMGAIALLAGG
ncbi:MAG: adenosylcobinamide-GDP ribazoletransferase [Arenibacterium sp.]